MSQFYTDKGKTILNIPHLRFQEFSGEWKAERLRDIAKLTKGVGISKDQLSESGEPCILYGELYTKYKSEIIEEVLSKTDIPTDKLMRSKANDVIIPCSGETAIDIATARCVSSNNVLLGGDLNIIRLKHHDGSFMSYQLNGKRKYDIAKVAQGVSVVHLYGEHLKGIVTYNPQLDEQKKIVSLLSLLDERIATQKKIIEDLKNFKSAIVDRLYTDVNGIFYSYGDLMTIVSEKNKSKVYSKILSASQELGMIERNELNIDIKYEESAITGYKIVHEGDYVVHLRSFQGGMAFSQKTGVCSPAYTILRPNGKLLDGYLAPYFTSIPFINSLRLVTYGIRDGRSINIDEWLGMKICIPSLDSQQHTLSIISCLSHKLSNESTILNGLLEQRKYLLQQMFI